MLTIELYSRKVQSYFNRTSNAMHKMLSMVMNKKSNVRVN